MDFFAAGKYDEALAQYQHAIALQPSFSDALHGIAQACYAKEDFDEAIVAARKLLELDPDDILAWTTISRSYQRQGKIPEAEEAGSKARVLGWKKQLQDQKSSPEKT
jgi:tetratricopeptide (TPR) repeat protein